MVGHRIPGQRLGGIWQAEQERKDREAIAAWDKEEHWPSINKPLCRDFDAKRFDARLSKLEDLGSGAFGRVDKVAYGGVVLARKRITRKRGLTIDDLRQEGLTMGKLDHCHVVKLVATYAPRSHELCLLIWPAAVCSLSVLLDDIEALRLGEGDRDDILERLGALGLAGAGEAASSRGSTSASARPLLPTGLQRLPASDDDGRPSGFLCTLLGCVARAMAHCHGQGVRHLDIKPSNILLSPDRVYLADFGISRDVSGQDHTTTDGIPGTERWRAPELYGDDGFSMQLSDMYSLGLVYLSIATVLHDARLSDFEEALRYSPRLCLDDRLRVREDKLKRHLDKLTGYALVTPRFMHTHEGQETVRPRPVVGLIAHMIATNPRNRLPAEKVDEKLSILGGIHQIYHAACCKRPVSWVEDRWNRKLTALASFKNKHEQQRRRIRELEDKDETYEARIENARKAHEQDVARLQALLKEAEEKCQGLELDKSACRKTHGHEARRVPPRPTAAGVSHGSERTKNRANPTSTTASAMEQKKPARPPPAAVTGPADKTAAHRSPSVTNWTDYRLRSRGSGSKLPPPVTLSRSDTPVLAQDQSMTDSSMSLSILSRRSMETAPTPAGGSPQLQRAPPSGERAKAEPQQQQQQQQQLQAWTELPRRDRRRSSAAIISCDSSVMLSKGGPASPLLSATSAASVASSPRAPRPQQQLGPGTVDADATPRPVIPSLQLTKSWADVAKLPVAGLV